MVYLDIHYLSYCQQIPHKDQQQKCIDRPGIPDAGNPSVPRTSIVRQNTSVSHTGDVFLQHHLVQFILNQSHIHHPAAINTHSSTKSTAENNKHTIYSSLVPVTFL